MLKVWHRLTRLWISFRLNHWISSSVGLKAERTRLKHTRGWADICVTTRLHQPAVDLLVFCILLLPVLEVLTRFGGWSQSLGWYDLRVVCLMLQLLRKRHRRFEEEFVADRPQLHGNKSVFCSYLFVQRRGRVQAWWCRGSWGGSPTKVLILFIINVPSIVGAASKLVKAWSFFSLDIVDLGFCVFEIPAEKQKERLNDADMHRRLIHQHSQGRKMQKRQRGTNRRLTSVHTCTERMHARARRTWSMHNHSWSRCSFMNHAAHVHTYVRRKRGSRGGCCAP